MVCITLSFKDFNSYLIHFGKVDLLYRVLKAFLSKCPAYISSPSHITLPSYPLSFRNCFQCLKCAMIFSTQVAWNGLLIQPPFVCHLPPFPHTHTAFHLMNYYSVSGFSQIITYSKKHSLITTAVPSDSCPSFLLTFLTTFKYLLVESMTLNGLYPKKKDFIYLASLYVA